MSDDLAARHTVQWTPGQPGALAVLTVIGPDGTSTTPSVTENAGTYSAVVVTGLPGQYLLRWVIAGSVHAESDVLNVWPEHPRFILSMDAARRAAAKPGPSADDELIRLLNAAATAVIESLAGIVLAKPIVQTTSGGRRACVLWHKLAPDADVIVRANGTVLVDGQDYVVDRHAMIVYAGSTTDRGWFPPGQLNIEIEYSTGGAVAPNIEQAAIELVRHQWKIGHQAVHADWTGDPSQDDDLVQTDDGFWIPKRVYQLCKPAQRLPGF